MRGNSLRIATREGQSGKKKEKKWVTSYELGFPLVLDKYERPMQPLVETFVDGHLEAYSTEEEGANASLLPLIGLLRTMKEGWGEQASTELSLIDHRAATRERFLTSQIARNLLKLSDIELVNEAYLFMIKNPPAVGAVSIHMDPESIDTLFLGITANTFQGVATLITPAGPFKMEGVRWHLRTQVFSSPQDMKADLYKEGLFQEAMDEDPNCRSFS